jgi:hypothetical protein
MHRILRHKLLAGGAAAAVLALGGGAYAATQTGSNPRQAFLNDVAKRLNVSPSQLNSALKGAFIDRLNAAVKAGMLTQAQADQIEKRIQNGKGVPFFGLGGGGRGFGGHGFGGHGFFHGNFGAGGPAGAGGPFSAAASYLGLSASQLMTDVSSGKSLAQIAGSKGKSVSGLENAMTSAFQSQLDKAVSAGRLTKSREQDILNRVSSKIDKIVNLKAPHGFFAPGFHKGSGAYGSPSGAPPWGSGGPPSGSGGPPSGAGGPPPGTFGGTSGPPPVAPGI